MIAVIAFHSPSGAECLGLEKLVRACKPNCEVASNGEGLVFCFLMILYVKYFVLHVMHELLFILNFIIPGNP